MKFSGRMMVIAVLLLAAIGYTVYNWITGSIDASTAMLYILVFCFPFVRGLSAFVKQLKASQE